MSSPKWLLYGAYGHTGRLIVEEIQRRRHASDRSDLSVISPIPAGRNRGSLDKLAQRLDYPPRVFGLDDANEIVRQIDDVDAVLNCAGPFSATAVPMIEACLATGAHYLDITGEIAAIEAAAGRSSRAQKAGVTLMPAVGFDVVPSDCLAVKLAERLPDACRLELALTGTGTISRGTARTMLEGLGQGGRVRKGGRIETVPLGWKSKLIPFRDGTRPAVTVAWGDIATAWHSTAIPDIEVYVAMEKSSIKWLRRIGSFAPYLLAPLPERISLAVLRRFMLGSRSPSEDTEQGAAVQGSFWGCVYNDLGQRASATLTTPSAYRLTALTALGCLEKTLAGETSPGFTTPGEAFGGDFILSIPETSFRWESTP